MNGRVLAIPLGELPRPAVEAAVRARFGASELAWLERQEVRRAPFRALVRLLEHQYDAAVLVAPDLGQSRLRLTSLLLGLPRARTRWRMDLSGSHQPWSLVRHLADNAWPVVRHAAACGLALALAEPLLRVAERVVAPDGRRTDATGGNPAQRTPSGRNATSGDAITGHATPRNASRGNPVRILYLRSQLWLGLAGGGSVAHTAGVIGGLEQSGVRVDVVSSDRLVGVQAPTTIARPETWFDGWLRELEDLAYNVPFFATALRTARRCRPEVIYQRHTAFNCSGAVLARLLRLPLVLEFNSSELWKGRYWGGLRLVGAAARVERINLRAADLVVVISQTLRGQVEAAGISPAKILVNPNGVDATQFRPDIDASKLRQELGINPADIVVGFSGTFGEWHGIPTLAQAVPRVLEDRPGVRWLLLGDGPLRRLVDDVVAAHSLDQRVLLPGLVPHADMPEYLAACDVLVSPHGRQADGGEFFGSPTKLYEYMATGKPIVASAVGQIAETLDNQRSALLVPPDDPEALSMAIVRLVDDRALRIHLGQAARHAAVQRHTWRHNAERLLAALAAPATPDKQEKQNMPDETDMPDK